MPVIALNPTAPAIHTIQRAAALPAELESSTYIRLCRLSCIRNKGAASSAQRKSGTHDTIRNLLLR